MFTLEGPDPGKFLHQELSLVFLMPTGYEELLNMLLHASYIPSFLSLGKKYSRDHQLLSSALSYTYFGLYTVELCSQHK